jgi:hypothetical protein
MKLPRPDVRRVGAAIGAILRPARGLLLGGAIGIPLGLYGVALGSLTGFLVDQTIRRARSRRLPPAARWLVTVIRYCSGSREMPNELLATTMSVLVASGTISPTERLGISPAQWRLPVLSAEAHSAARRLRDELSSEYVLEICAALRRASAQGAIHESETVELLGWLHGAETDVMDDDVRRAATILGLEGSASVTDAKRAYRHLAAQFHPDTTLGLSEDQRREAAEAFRRVQEAYETFVAFRGGAK